MCEIQNNNEKTLIIKQKRERSVNFTREETDILMSLAMAKKHIIENKKSDAATWQEKQRAWKDIERSFNRKCDSVFRSHVTLKLKYEGIKRDTRRKCHILRAKYCKIDDKAPALVFTPVERKMKEIILPVEENDNTSTSDSEMRTNEQNEQMLQDDSYGSNIIEIQEDSKSRTKRCEVSESKDPPECELNEKLHSEESVKENIEIAKIKKQILAEELEQKVIQRKILEKDLEHKDIIHELEQQHLILKIKLLKKELEKM